MYTTLKSVWQKSVCCPPFDPELWDDRVLEWKNKRFIKDRVFTFLYMPMNFSTVMKNLAKLASLRDASTMGGLCLSDHVSPWKMDVYLAVDKEIPGIENVIMNGKFFSRVYEGPLRDIKKWGEDYKKAVRERKLHIEQYYIWYTTCPTCAKLYGNNYVAIVSKINEDHAQNGG